MFPYEPAPGTVITWYKRFSPRGRWYQYAAVHVAGRGWYTTDTIRRSPWSWGEIIQHIGDFPAYVLQPFAQLPTAPTMPPQGVR